VHAVAMAKLATGVVPHLTPFFHSTKCATVAASSCLTPRVHSPKPSPLLLLRPRTPQWPTSRGHASHRGQATLSHHGHSRELPHPRLVAHHPTRATIASQRRRKTGATSTTATEPPARVARRPQSIPGHDSTSLGCGWTHRSSRCPSPSPASLLRPPPAISPSASALCLVSKKKKTVSSLCLSICVSDERA
jgi:hypothetical protein